MILSDVSKNSKLLLKQLSFKTLSIVDKSVNGEIYEFPKTITVPCGQLIPVGLSRVRVYDISDCIVVYKLYLVRHNEDVFGTEQFDSLDGFEQYVNSSCSCCGEVCCYLTYNGCDLTFNGQLITYNPN